MTKAPPPPDPLSTTPEDAGKLVARAAVSSVATAFRDQARQLPQLIAIDDGVQPSSYAELLDRVEHLCGFMLTQGLGRGSRIALLSENRREVLEVFLAAASLGAVVACQNFRLSTAELSHCMTLVEPSMVFVSTRYRGKLGELELDTECVEFGHDYGQRLSASEPLTGEHWERVASNVHPEDPLLILYTSGTTGLPKGAVISHRAELYRNLVIRAEFGVAPEDTFVAWTPLYHMGATDPALGTLMSGGKVVVVDGFDQDRLIDVLERERVGWFLVMPGMIGAFADELERRQVNVAGVEVCGVMADLVPPLELARITRLLNAPYANTFGSTETGCPPCSSNLIPVGAAPSKLSKKKSPFCEVRLVNAAGQDVEDGRPGELIIRGPTLFSGYFRAEDVNREEFRGGWFHMGDVFQRNPDGSLDFVDRVKYLIKSGGENIYPAELERVLQADERVLGVAVVRAPDTRWGEVPVAFIARRDESLTEPEVERRCRAELASYKRPKRVIFIAMKEFPRSASGKIQRHELEKRL